MATPLLGLNEIVAGVGGDSPSQAWNKVILNFQTIDSHDHTTGAGAAITTAALNIDGSLSFNNNAATNLSRTTFQSLTAAPTVNSSLYVLDGDLVYRNSLGNVIPVTSGSGLGTTPGAITGLAAPATVVFSPTTDTYTFSHDTPGLKALLNTSNIIMQEFTLSGNTQPSESVTLAVPTLVSSHTITWPTAGPGGNNYYMRFNASGEASYVPGFSSSGVTSNQLVRADSDNSLVGFTLPANQLVLGTAGTPTVGQLTNAYVDAAAAIAGTKITPAFGSQNVSTTGTASFGGTTATSLTSTGTLTVATTATFNGVVNIADAGDSFTVAPPSTFNSSVTVAGTTTLNGNTVIGNSTSDTITFTSRAVSDLVPSTTASRNLGSSSLRWNTVYGATGNFSGNVSSNTATFTNSITVSSGNTAGNGIVIADDGDMVDLNDGYLSMRFSNGVIVKNGNAGAGTNTEITLGSDGYVKARGFRARTVSGSITFLDSDLYAMNTARMLGSGKDLGGPFAFNQSWATVYADEYAVETSGLSQNDIVKAIKVKASVSSGALSTIYIAPSGYKVVYASGVAAQDGGGGRHALIPLDILYISSPAGAYTYIDYSDGSVTVRNAYGYNVIATVLVYLEKE